MSLIGDLKDPSVCVFAHTEKESCRQQRGCCGLHMLLQTVFIVVALLVAEQGQKLVFHGNSHVQVSN